MEPEWRSEDSSEESENEGRTILEEVRHEDLLDQDSSSSSLEDFDFLFPSQNENARSSRNSGNNDRLGQTSETLAASQTEDRPESQHSQPERFHYGDSQSSQSSQEPNRIREPPRPPPNIDSTLIWGTTIHVKDSLEKFSQFFRSFSDPTSGISGPLYPHLLVQIKSTMQFILNLNLQFLKKFDLNLFKQLIFYPVEILSIAEKVINDFFCEMFSDFVEEMKENLQKIEVRPFNLGEFKQLRNLNPEDLEKLISVKGMITRTSTIIPDLVRAFFQCSLCRGTIEVSPEHGKLQKPLTCTHCKARETVSLVHNRSSFSDKQWIKLQEVPDDIPEGETPHTVSMYAYHDLVDSLRPGDRVIITGVYRAIPVSSQLLQRSVKSIYKTYIDILHVAKTDLHRLRPDDEDEEQKKQQKSENSNRMIQSESDHLDQLIEEREHELRKLGELPDIYARLVRSVAPSVWEMHDVKLGILCQLFGGTHKRFSETGLGRFRGDINILLCGDPGTSKSQLLTYVHKIAPRGIYTSGKGSSAVGLTAYVTKDPETGEAILESGALVLSDRGICCIDEFDKMSDTTRSVLHEVMEQQTVSVAKAGIIASLNARTSILAVANPRESRYNPKLSVVENVQLPPTLLSRFDLIYLILDKPDERTDRRLAQHIIGLHFAHPRNDDLEVIPMETLTHYIAYARKHVHPRIDDDVVVNELVKGYVDMRKVGASRKTISATPRQLEAVIRLAEAHAKMRLSSVVERSDVVEALRLMRSALQQAAVDPRTGTIDMDLITTGKSALSRTRLAELTKEARSVLNAHDTILKFDALLKLMSEQSQIEISAQELKEALKELEDTEFIALTGDYRNPTIHKL